MTVLPGMIDTPCACEHGRQHVGAARADARWRTRRPISMPASPPCWTWIRAAASTPSICAMPSIPASCKGRACRWSANRINQRATNYYPDAHSDPLGRYYDGFTETKNVNSPWLARAAVRESKLHGVDYIKIYTTQDFVGPMHMWRPDATLVNSPSLTFEEVEAIVDEAHRLGLKVACHTYGGEGMRSCLTAGVDAPNHLLELDDAGVQVLLQKKLPFVPTIDDLIALEAARPARYRRAKLAAEDARAGRTPGGRRRRADRVRQRRDVARDPAWQAGQPVRLLRQMGTEPGAGAADGLSSGRPHAQLRLGEARSAASRRASSPTSSRLPAIR